MLFGSPLVEESKLLGVLFDIKNKLNTSKVKCLKELNILKVLSHTSLRTGVNTLIKLYRSLVRSNLDNVSIIIWFSKEIISLNVCSITQLGLS